MTRMGSAPVVIRDEDFPAVDGPVALDRFLRERHPGASWNAVRRLVVTGKVLIDGTVTMAPNAVVPAGSTVSIRMTARRPTREGRISADAIVYVDPHVVVVRKPSGIATVPYEDERDTMDRLVQGLLRQIAPRGTSVAPLGVVQRLDKETSGVLVFARTAASKRHLQQQFRVHEVERRYVAIASGVVEGKTIRSRLVKDRGDGYRGSTRNAELGREAVTHVRVLERLAGATFIECRLETGRTHQIRIHLSEAGHPLIGERVYMGRAPSASLTAPRLMLHARELGFVHPVSGRALHFEDPLPEDFAGVLDLLRQAPAPDSAMNPGGSAARAPRVPGPTKKSPRKGSDREPKTARNKGPGT